MRIFIFTLAMLAMPMAASADNAQPTLGVVTGNVQLQSFYERIEALGTLIANESVDLTANVTEMITAVQFTDNQRVTKGTVLAEMTSAEEQAQLQEAQSTLKEAQKQLNRIEKLTKTGSAPRARLDEQRRLVDTARARLTAVKSRLKDRLIVAPFDGVVGLRSISAGALVEPGDVITTLDDDSQMKLDFTVPATYLASVKPGLAIKARSRAYQNQTFNGTIASIDSRIDPVTRSFTVRAILPNPDHLLKPGMLMQVVIESNPREALVIPEAALVPLAAKQFVYKIIQNETGSLKVQKTPVKIGNRSPGKVEIVEGLEEGDQIVIDGTIKLNDGASVTILDKAF